MKIERDLSIENGDLSSQKKNVDLENTTKSKLCDSKGGLKSLPERIPAFGLLLAVISTIFFSFQSVIVKVLTDLHSVEILVFRSLFELVVYLTIALVKKYRIVGEPGQRLHLATRAITGNISVVSIYIAYRLMPIADASTIHLTSPIFVAIFGYFLLKEKLTIVQIVTGIITMIGVVIIAKPEFIFGSESEIIHERRLEGTALAIVASVAVALVQISLRKLKSTPVPVIVIWHGLSIMISGIVILIIIDKLVWPTGWRTWGLLLASGIACIGFQYFFTMAFKYENAGPVSVVRTFNIVLVFIWEVLILSEIVEWTSIVGASLIFSCIIIISVFKWKTENPSHFESTLNKIICRKIEEKTNDKPVSIELLGQELTNPTN